ncbi:MAG: EAL domain-containing protein [Betaproteobacteria bacterium]|nr:EAL domain-containing protein [Betaproteobacteria bacterium]
MTAPLPGESPQDARDVMAAPLRAIAATIVVALLLGAVLNLAGGRPVTGSASLFGAAAAGFAWWWTARGGSLQTSASIAFYSLAFTLTVFMWVGQGTRDYGLAGYPAVLFLGCVFLARYAYWGLAAFVLAAVTVLGVAELTDLRPVVFGPPPELRNLINLWVIIGASAVGGRVLMRAVRSSLLRERSLSGALQSSEDRMQKILRSSQNAIVVSRFSDGTYLEVNDAFLAMFGYGREEVIGRTSVELGVWDDIAERERFISLLRDGQPVREFDTRQRKKSGEVIELLLSAESFDLEGEVRLMITATDITARRTAERRAEFLSTRDALTGLPNRAVAMDRLQQALERARRAGESVAVLHVDLDRFKAVNDSVGRRWGDELLRESRTRLESLMRQGDTLARIGGNEFLIIAHVRQPGDAEQMAANVVAAFEPPFTVEGRALRITCSVGASVYPDDSSDAESLLLYADTAMYEAKSEGRARHCLYAQVMSERVRDRLLVENSLRESIGRNDLRLVYQPKFDMKTRAITGVEALARWTHPKLGSVPPAQFIAIAEESDLICELGHWVLKESCAQIASWREQGLPALPVAVNLSARQITPELPAQLFACARERGVAPGMLELEVTETMLISQPDASRKVLEQVTRNGNSIVLDDFGVGYSSLGYVKLLHLNGIKIDRSFVGDVVQSRHDKAIVSAIVGLAHGLGFRVVAEGIESEDQLQMLKQLGCDEAQGFHMCRPLSGEQLAADFLARGVGMH